MKNVLNKYLYIIIFSVALLGTMIFSSSNVGHVVFMIVLGILTIECTYEIIGCVGIKKRALGFIPSIFYVVSIVVFVFVIKEDRLVPFALLLTIGYLIVMLSITIFTRGTIKLGQAAQVITFSLYFVLSFICIFLMRYNYDSKGNLLYLSLFLISILTVFVFKIVNKYFGKHMLFIKTGLHITIEGMIFSLVMSIVLEVVHGLFLKLILNINVNFFSLLLITLICSIFAMVSYFIFSFLKKENDITHYVSLNPRKYGLLEIYNGVLFTAPIIYFIYSIFSPSIFIT